jgi:acyl-CoA thioester hydrolase
MTDPGGAATGTAVESVGRSSFTLRQSLFQADTCVAVARTVMVLFDERSRPP